GDVIDRHELDFTIVERGAHDVAADTPEAVNSYFNGHAASGKQIARPIAASILNGLARWLFFGQTKQKCYGGCAQLSNGALGNHHGYSVTRTTLSPWKLTKVVLAGG